MVALPLSAANRRRETAAGHSGSDLRGDRAIAVSVGTWRSLVARTLGVREVAGSNPVVPTIQFNDLAEAPESPFSTWCTFWCTPT